MSELPLAPRPEEVGAAGAVKVLVIVREALELPVDEEAEAEGVMTVVTTVTETGRVGEFQMGRSEGGRKEKGRMGWGGVGRAYACG